MEKCGRVAGPSIPLHSGPIADDVEAVVDSTEKRVTIVQARENKRLD